MIISLAHKKTLHISPYYFDGITLKTATPLLLPIDYSTYREGFGVGLYKSRSLM
ncbi:hypothetical protein ADICYQ_5286 [Cyclobacterium qasimii M12-11B]|uniref:Uncharacterized protein n=1 Tax=Cyclobacterium qasimii M12-11B TaxID=641524 RepID=S7V821_9BACT|nr:hypothetical protein ADICYQ_5286 [Cyclobacterium qasimii M12-11B]